MEPSNGLGSVVYLYEEAVACLLVKEAVLRPCTAVFAFGSPMDQLHVISGG
jgi:hypothetical protein